MKTKNILLALAPFAVLGVIACGGAGDDATEGPGAQAQPTVSGSAAAEEDGKKIVLEVTGPKKASITYGLSGETSQDNGAKLPWKKTLTMPENEMFAFASVMGQNAGATGTIKCKITVDGKVVKTNSSTGEYAIVDCSASGF